MKNVRDILKVKGGDAWTVGPDETVYDALKVLAEKDIGALLVLDGERVAGIFSERDYARKIIMMERRSQETKVREIMTTDVLCVSPERTVEECMALMTDKHIRHLPVMEEDRVAGVISIGDVVKAIISEKQFLIEQLEQYILGG